MSESLQAKLDRLEILYAEQEYTIQALNDMVSQQSQDISRLNAGIEQLKGQLQVMRSELSSDTGSGYEKPPHY